MPVVHHGVAPARVHPALQSASHVLLRVDAVRRPLVPPYLGPFPVLQRGQKTFLILQNGSERTVTIDRLKPAFLSAPLPVSDLSSATEPSDTSSPAVTGGSSPIFTRSGRVSRPVLRFQN